MATKQDGPEAERLWLEAKKIIHGMQKKLGQMNKDDSSNKKLADLDAVEHMLETLRLTCMATTFSDFKFAHENRVLDKLWQVHSLISTEYKKVLQRHRGHGQIVQFRNIEKQYAKHLKTAQYFYKGFVERLSARYELLPLQRVARCMKSENIKINDVIDAEKAQLSQELNIACYRTLLHLGDLARYRMNTSRQKGHSPDMALTYYGLAQELMPQEGDAHHQMAVVMADQHKDFGVVYHFFRSWAVQNPNNLVPQNLASEFKKLLQPPSARKTGHGAPDPYDTFGSWLIRLHAHYFKGEDFTQQDELEREVLHRWEVLLKSAEQPAYLQKALLTNIAAYDVALRRVKEEWSTAKSRSCQFILRFIVQTILVLSRVLEAETQRLFCGQAATQENIPAATATAQKTSGGEGKAEKKKKSSTSDTCLALFRTCMAWILVRREDLVQFQDHLNPHIVEMHRAVTRCLSLFVEIISGTEAAPASYLLPEDNEVLGLAPLDGWTALRQGENSTAFKVRMDEVGVQRLDPALETLARIYDVVECAIKLVSDDAFPWLATTYIESNREVTRICYKDDYVMAAAAAAATVAEVSPVPSVPSVPPVLPVSRRRPSVPAQQPEFARSPPAKSVSAKPVSTKPVSVQPLAATSTAKVKSPTARKEQTVPWSNWSTTHTIMAQENNFVPASHLPPEPETSNLAVDSELGVLDSETFSRVETFLSPPEVPKETVKGPQLSTLPSSPYGMHTSTINDIFGQLEAKSPSAIGSTVTPGVPSAPSTGPGTARTFPSLPWELFYQPTPYQSGAASWGRSAAAPAATTTTDGAVGQRMSSLSLTQGLDSSSRGFPTVLSPVGPAQTSLPAAGSPWGSSKDNRLLALQLQQAQAETLGISPSNNSAAGFFYPSSFTTNLLSSMPSVQSPRGLPGDPYGGLGSPGSGGISGINSSSQQNMQRKWQEAATAWGRGIPASRDDPTHFRNAVRGTTLMDETNAYDRNALLSALDSPSQSPRYHV